MTNLSMSPTQMEMFQYRAALVMTGAIKATSYNLLFQEIGLESMADRRWSRKIPSYLYA